MYTLKGHQDTITSLALSPDGGSLLSNAMDNTIRVWDCKPFAPENRLTTILEGASHGAEKNLLTAAWNGDGSRVAAGSIDRSVLVWYSSTMGSIWLTNEGMRILGK